MKYLLPALVAVFALAGLAGPSEARHRLFHERAMTPETFAQKVAGSDEFEIQSSQIALQKSNNQQIKSFAQRMIDDHTKINNQLKDLLKQANMQEPSSELDSQHQAMLNKLKNESGTKFERTYVKDQRNGHKQAVRLLEGYSKSGTNETLKKFASDSLPIIKEHLKLAEALPSGGNLTAKR